MKKFENVYQDAALMKKALLGEANESEQQELEKRLAECPDLQKVYEQLQNGETLRVAFGEYKNYSSKKAYESFLQKIGQTEPEVIKKPRTFRVWWSVAAAVVFLVIGLSFYMSNYGSIEEESRPLIQPGVQQAQLTLPDGSIIDVHKKEVNVIVDGVQVKYKEGVLSYEPTVTTQHEEKNVEEKPVKSNELIIPRGGENTVILADGTTVHLNAGSKLTYPVRFAGKRRVVALEGEAYFKVTKDPKRPFIVKTKTVQTRVLGTEFNIRSYTPEDTHVVLINGKVEVSNTKGGSYTRLYPGEDAHLQSDGNFILAEVDLDSYVYWKDGYFYFDNVTLKDIMQNLGRWYNVNIEFRNKEAMEYKMHFISDRTKDLEHTISLLNRMKKVTVTLQGNTLTVD